jgi:hypothetical protein
MEKVIPSFEYEHLTLSLKLKTSMRKKTKEILMV